MAKTAVARLGMDDLRRELDEFRERYHTLGDDEIFVLWFLRAFVTDSDADAAAALCGGAGDKSVDAVLIDDPARIVFLVQGKYRKDLGTKAEKRNDVTAFAQLAVDLTGDASGFATLTKDMAPEVISKLEAARNRVTRRGYALQLY